jgi:hypothetical protein
MLSWLGKKIEIFLIPLFILIIIYNTSLFLKLDSVIEPKKGYAYDVTFNYYNIDEALTAAKKEGYSNSLYVSGALYDIFSQLLNGFSLNDIRKMKKIVADFKGKDWLGAPFEDIHGNKDIQLLIITPDWGKEYNEKTITNLKKLGWSEWKVFNNKGDNLLIIGLKRD